jgi:predicted AlkP superfamily pyrophosphatase or phosphodiesterase
MMRVIAFLVAVLAAAASLARAGQTTVVWISLDGLRNDYVQRSGAPTLTRLEKEGTYTNQERPIFPSLTFPNHMPRLPAPPSIITASR